MCVCAKAALILYWNNKEVITKTNSLCLENKNFIPYALIICFLSIIIFMVVVYYFKLHSYRYVW